jgi:prepilin signal peptidase PulO-like enzyme (type II secretory pathway)
MIKYKLVVFLMLGAFLQAVSAQGMDKNHHIEFYGGVAFPVGKFGKPLFNSFSAENGQQATLNFNGAKLGTSYGLVADFYVINEYLGILINVNAATNSIGDAASYPVAKNYVQNIKWKTTTLGNWHSIQALLGVTARYPIVDWLLVTGRAAIGYSHLVVPYFSAEGTTSLNRYIYTNSISTPSKGGFGYLAGVGLQFCVTSAIGFHLRGDYSGSSAIAFRGNKVAISEVYLNNNLENSTTFEFHESFQAINVNIGLSLAF